MLLKKGKWILLLIIFLTVIFILGFTFYNKNQENIKQAQEKEQIQKEQKAQLDLQQQIEAQKQLQIETAKNQILSGNIDENTKIVFLTFDDGPDLCSNEVLDILKRNDVQATFFTNGRTGPENEEIYRRIVNEGHVLANHSYSHDYSLYNNTQAFIDDVIQQENNIRSITGVEPVKIFRFPGGSNITDSTNINALTSLGYNYFDWTASAGDGADVILSTPEVISKIETEVAQNPVSIILCHGEKPDKTTTREALEPLITQLKANGYTFLTLDPSYNFDKAKFE